MRERAMKIRALSVVLGLALLIGVSLAAAGVACAEPGAAYLQAQGGAMIPVGAFHSQQHIGGGYSILAGYEMLEFLDLNMQFTQTFNDNRNSASTFSGPGFTGVSNETNQTFVVGFGPRINFLPSDYLVRPFGVVQVEWDHFAYFNEVTFNHQTLISDNDQDAVGIQAGLGVEGTIFQLYNNRNDTVPLLELTVGAYGSYHQAFQPGRPDKQFVTTMATFGARF
jgi:hypothetical protein